ncbi:MAG TPA: hypothetical protein VG294_18050 [Solirubrobacteraceae bacterium]|nr:hypothetical protein [Solirubrobacteraceae bacterium]
MLTVLRLSPVAVATSPEVRARSPESAASTAARVCPRAFRAAVFPATGSSAARVGALSWLGFDGALATFLAGGVAFGRGVLASW